MSHLSQKSNWFSHIHNVPETKRGDTGADRTVTWHPVIQQPICSIPLHSCAACSECLDGPALLLCLVLTEQRGNMQAKENPGPAQCGWWWAALQLSGDPKREQNLQKEHKTQSLETHVQVPALEQTQCVTLTKHSLFSKVGFLGSKYIVIYEICYPHPCDGYVRFCGDARHMTDSWQMSPESPLEEATRRQEYVCCSYLHGSAPWALPWGDIPAVTTTWPVVTWTVRSNRCIPALSHGAPGVNQSYKIRCCQEWAWEVVL